MSYTAVSHEFNVNESDEYICIDRYIYMNICIYATLRLVIRSCPTLCEPMDCSPPGSSVHRDSPGTNIEVGCHALLQAIFLQIELGSPALQVNSLPSEPPGKHKNTGVGR